MKNLKTIKIKNLQKVQSSNIAQVGFDGNTTYVVFTNGSIYKYPDTTEEAYQTMIKAESVGSYFSKTYRKLPKFEKLEDTVLKREEKAEKKNET